ncbi:MAG: ABC transporter substrate-binding protein [Microbacterium sp.]
MFISTPRRRLAVVAPVLGGLVIGLTACGGGGGDSASDELTIIAANSPWVEGLTELASTYEEETGVTVNIEAYGNEQLNDTLKVKLNAQSADFDIMAYQVQDVMREFSRNGWLADMTEYVEEDPEWGWEDFQPAAREAVQLDGAVYGVPVMTERHIMYYRADVLEEAGIEVPQTLDELEQAAAELNDPDAGFYGIAMRGARVPMVTQLSSFIYSFGGDFQDENGDAAIDSPEALAGYELYGDLLRESGPPGSTNMGWVEASAIFAQGNAAFYLDADSQAYTFLDEENSAVVDTVDFARFPEGPAGSNFYNIVPQTAGINEFSDNKDEAWEFIKWASNEENSKWLLSEETVPVARESAWADDEASAGFPEGLVDIVRNLDDGAVGHDRPSLEQVAAAREIVGGPAITAIEGGDVESAVTQANEEFQGLLDAEE